MQKEIKSKNITKQSCLNKTMLIKNIPQAQADPNYNSKQSTPQIKVHNN